MYTISLFFLLQRLHCNLIDHCDLSDASLTGLHCNGPCLSIRFSTCLHFFQYQTSLCQRFPSLFVISSFHRVYGLPLFFPHRVSNLITSSPVIFFLSYNVAGIFPFQFFNHFTHVPPSCSYFAIYNFVYFPYSTHLSLDFPLYFLQPCCLGLCKCPGLCTIHQGRKGYHSQNIYSIYYRIYLTSQHVPCMITWFVAKSKHFF